MILTKSTTAGAYVAPGRGAHEDASYAQGAPPSFCQELVDRSAIMEPEPESSRSFFEICADCKRHMNNLRQDAGRILVDSKPEPSMGISQEDATITVGPEEYRKLVIVDATLSDVFITMPDPATCENKEVAVKKASSDNTTHVVNILPHDNEKFDDDRLYDSMQLTDAGDKLHFVSDGTNWQIWGGRF